jgi:CubicO group peptidase (beta-lactamase class C family)
MNFLTIMLAITFLNSAPEQTSSNLATQYKEHVNLHIGDVKQYLDEKLKEKHFSGVIMIAQGDKILFNTAYGMASETEPNEPNTVFHVASVTKQFTAAAIMQLHEAGKIDLNAPINDYLSKEYRSESWKDVTVHHLLSHTGGIADYTEEKSWQDLGNGFCFSEIGEMIRDSQAKGLEFAPGSNMRYSNLGYTLLGCIIEQASGIPYEEYIQNHLLVPLEMHSSGIHGQNYAKADKHAEGHRWNESKQELVSDDEKTLAVTSADGGLYTTTSDFLKWSKMLLNPKQGILSKESIKSMVTPHTLNLPKEIDDPDEYGYGLFVHDSSPLKFSHPGFIPGFRSHIAVYPEKDLHILIFCNNTSANPYEISNHIENILNNGLGLV